MDVTATPPIVEFVVTGDEVMRGTIADTNTAWTAARLYPLGLSLRRTTVVGDRGEDIRRALLEASVRELVRDISCRVEQDHVPGRLKSLRRTDVRVDVSLLGDHAEQHGAHESTTP